MQNYRYSVQECMGRTMNVNNCRRNDMEEQCYEREAVSCHGREEHDPLKHLPIAMAYVPWQRWKDCDFYDLDKGFQRGTIFMELDKPFHGEGGCHS